MEKLLEQPVVSLDPNLYNKLISYDGYIGPRAPSCLMKHIIWKLDIKINLWMSVMKPAQEKMEKIDQRLRIQPLRGGNLLYIT